MLLIILSKGDIIMKKFFAFLLSIIIACAFAACDSEAPPPSNSDDTLTPPTYEEEETNGQNTSQPENHETQNTTEAPAKTPINAKLTQTLGFQNGYAVVSFEQNKKNYGAIIDADGVILYRAEIDEPTATGNMIDNWFYIGDDSFGVSYKDGAQTKYAIVNANGETLASSDNGDFDIVLAAGNDHAIVYKSELSGIEYKHYIAAFNTKGELVNTPVEIPQFEFYNGYNGTFDQSDYLGEGQFIIYCGNSAYGATSHLIYNQKTGKVIFYGNIEDCSSFKNGSALLQVGYYYEPITEDIIWVGSSDRIKLKTDGTYTLTEESINEYENATIAEKVKKLYPSSTISGIYSCGEYYTIALSNEGNGFFTVLDNNGQQMFNPIPYTRSIYASSDSIVYASAWGDMFYGEYPTYHLVDIATGNEISTFSGEFQITGGYSDGLAPAYVRHEAFKYSYYYVNTDGEIIIKKLYE